jgi:prephenate dehydrogenase
MKIWDKVAIVGVGLIGGSIGLALRERKLAREVIGSGRRRANLDSAQRMGAITSGTTVCSEAVGDADLILVCTPVDSIASHVREIAAACRRPALITDAGSTKHSIVSQLDGKLDGKARYVGSHPLAGSEKTGPEHARADLFVDRTVVVTPGETSQSDDVEAICALWSSLGARVMRMSPADHDQIVAGTSHLPHLVAAALAAASNPADAMLTAGGWRDTTRVAGGDPKLWKQILLDNRTNVLNSLSRFETKLGSLHAALENGDEELLIQLLTEAKANRDAVGS